ncbi:MAG: VOC family protein [Candidatus Lustribacter sp.]|jgi:catechol 2,3-dioxygenase-like lactoylglutathione lyase family enzyme
MPRPQIRHIALFADDTEKMAQFYHDVFEMDIIHRSPNPNGPVFISDGYITVAILQHNADGQAVRGLNHIGFKVESNALIGERMAETGVAGPRKRPADRPYAEQRGLDPEGNMFDISQHGFERVETEADRTAQPAKEPLGAAIR